MPRRDLPMNPARMLGFDEIPEPTSDAANVPGAVSTSKAAEDRPSSTPTPAPVFSRPSVSFVIPAAMADPFYQLRRGLKPGQS